jgi:hypothetical protein
MGIAFYITQQPEAPILKLDMKNSSELPRNFRMTRSEFKRETVKPLPSRMGLDQLNLSGSAQFSEKALEVILKEINTQAPIYIVDLRQESHGFLNGEAVSWYLPRNLANENKTLAQIMYTEEKLLQEALKQRQILVHTIEKKDFHGIKQPETKSFPLTVSSANTEEQLSQRHQLHYVRIPVTDHRRPSDEQVDRFIAFFKSLPKESWVHMHCAAGVGRATTFMSMYDMLTNAKQVSFDDIMERQWLIGGADLRGLPDQNKWKYSYAEERLQFLKEFYQYCQSDESSWQNFVQQRTLTLK